MRFFALPAVVVMVVALAAGCGDDGGTGAPSEGDTPGAAGVSRNSAPATLRPPTQLSLPVKVAVTMPLFQPWAQIVGKENVQVISLIPAGADPHTYQFTDADLQQMKGVKFFFLNGLGLDTRLQDAIEANRDEDAHVIPFAPNIRSPQGGDKTAEEAGDNAHLWLDPSLATVYPEIIADELNIYDGVNQDFYTHNFTAYRDQVTALTAELTATLAGIPQERRKLITYHDAFPHFARKFGFQVTGFAVPAPGGQPAQAEIDRLAQLVRDNHIPAVFAEHGYDADVINQVASRSGAAVCTLYSDILDSAVGSYEDLMHANARELVRCLGGP